MNHNPISDETELIRSDGTEYILERTGHVIRIYNSRNPAREIGSMERYSRLSDLTSMPCFPQKVKGSVVEELPKGVFKVGGREVIVLRVGADIFPPVVFVYDKQTEEKIGEFSGRLPTEEAFRKSLINIVYGRDQ